jgi:methyl-accepting chemotaxis protein
MSNLSIRSKLLISFGSVIFGLILLGALSLNNLEKVSKISLNVATVDAHQVVSLYRILDLGATHRNEIITHVGLSEVDDMKLVEETIHSLEEKLNLAVDKEIKYEQSEEDMASIELLEHYLESRKLFTELTQEIVNESQSYFKEEALALTVGEASDTFKVSERLLLKLIDIRLNKLNDKADEASSISDKSEVIIIASVSIITLISVIFGLIVSRSITKPVDRLLYLFKEFSNGNLNLQCDSSSDDELGKVISGFIESVNAIASIMRRISSVAIQLAASSEEFTSISKETSVNIERQKDEINRIIDLSENMRTGASDAFLSAQGAYDSASQCLKKSNDSKDVVSSTIGNIGELVDVVGEAQNEMSELEKNSTNIETMLVIIKGIAEQTNLLALNAAIEAARAGEHGRGFAVVADEVRTLSMKTQKSTQDIESLISQLQEGTKNTASAMKRGLARAQENVSYAENTGKALNDIDSGISDISRKNELIKEIAERQKDFSEKVRASTGSISEMANISVNATRQNEIASSELASMASDLQSMMEQFILD